MLRLLTPLEQNTSWIPHDKYFLSAEQTQELLQKTKSCDDPVSFHREELPTDYFNKKIDLPPTPPDGITVSQINNDFNL